MKIKKRILSLALAGTMVLGLMPGMSMTALAADGDTSYTLTIPSTLNVANSGWNATSGISAMGTLADGKKLTVTASSGNSWALKSGENSVGYNLATATGTYISTAQPASWEFTELSSTATTKPMGIIVDDYSSKPAGTYQDTVTFTAKVETAQILVTSLELTDNSMFFYGKAWPGVGGGFTLNIRVLPENATNKRLNWSIDGDNCISLSVTDDTLTCHVTGKEPGEANIIVSTTDGSNLSQTFSVEVEEPGEEGGNPEDPGDL